MSAVAMVIVMIMALLVVMIGGVVQWKWVVQFQDDELVWIGLSGRPAGAEGIVVVVENSNSRGVQWNDTLNGLKWKSEYSATEPGQIA